MSSAYEEALKAMHYINEHTEHRSEVIETPDTYNPSGIFRLSPKDKWSKMGKPVVSGNRLLQFAIDKGYKQ